MPGQPPEKKSLSRHGVGATERYRAPAELKPHPQAGLVPAMTRREYASLCASVEDRGLRTPLDIDAEGTVLDGHQRLRVALELGLEQVPVRIVAPTDQVEYLVEAAIRRRQLLPSQLAALAVELREYWQARAEARCRSQANLNGQPERATLPAQGRTRDWAAQRVGASPRTIQDAATVRQFDPELFERVKSGEVPAHKAARQIRRARQALELAHPPPLPTRPFELIYADPPWQLGSPDSEKAPENHYPTMPLEEIKALAVPAAEEAILFLWAVACLLPQALEVMTAWGFAYKTDRIWVKERVGLGTWVRHRHEHLLIGVRGRFAPPDPSLRLDSVIEAPRRRHSQKPDCVYEELERAYPRASKLELFARSARPGWAAWGNEVAD